MTQEERQKDFSKLVKEALKSFSITTITRLFDVSKPTVQRWANGINYPHPVMMGVAEKSLKILMLAPEERQKRCAKLTEEMRVLKEKFFKEEKLLKDELREHQDACLHGDAFSETCPICHRDFSIP
jgi:hypothetical protein